MIVTVVLLDTSFLYALTDTRDKNHGAGVALLPLLRRPLLLPMPVLSELCYLLHSRLGHYAMRRFLRELVDSEMRLLSLSNSDITRVTGLLEQYANVQLELADAAIVAMAEQYAVTQIATFDRRDFSIIRPRHTAFFELLP